MTVRVAFVHDHLVQRGGSERVLVSMLRAFPDAPVFTAFFRPEATYPELRSADVRCFAVDRVPALRRHHRAAFPALPFFFSRQRVDADVVICSSSGWAQAVQTDGRKVVYFHALAQWLHTPLEHVAGASAGGRLLFAVPRRTLMRWDRRTVLSADRYLVAGPTMQRRVREVYGVEAAALPPPAGIDPGGPAASLQGVAPGFFLSVARLMPYKNLDAILTAFAELPDERLVVAGEGPDARVLRRSAPPNVTFVGGADDAHLRWLYANCRALVCAGFEAYGLAPIEGAAFARPTVALREGGLIDVVVEGATGEFFDHPRAAEIAEAIRRLDGKPYDPKAFERVQDLHSEIGFITGLQRVVDEELRAVRR
jgi:glycosyltransferase involved in cell wall biosynthesis